IVLHFFGLAQVQLIGVARHPTVRDMDEHYGCTTEFGERRHMQHDGRVRLGILEWNQDALVHQAIQLLMVWYRSHALSVAMITATDQARIFTHSGLVNSPIFCLSDVNITSGNTANES